MKEFFKWIKTDEGITVTFSCTCIGLGFGFWIGIGVIGSIVYFNVMARYR